ncbi:MAG: AAA family ATPase, partial [bacterium]
MEKIRRVLFQRNPWWFGKGFEIPETKRKLFKFIIRSLRDERALQIVGLRRTGKTALLLQVIEKLLKEGLDPRRILYLSVGSMEFRGVENPIMEGFNYYYEEIAPKERKLYLFIDEAHFSDRWAE